MHTCIHNVHRSCTYVYARTYAYLYRGQGGGRGESERAGGPGKIGRAWLQRKRVHVSNAKIDALMHTGECHSWRYSTTESLAGRLGGGRTTGGSVRGNGAVGEDEGASAAAAAAAAAARSGATAACECGRGIAERELVRGETMSTIAMLEWPENMSTQRGPRRGGFIQMVGRGRGWVWAIS